MSVEVRSIKFDWSFFIMSGTGCSYILGIDILTFTGAQVNFPVCSITFENLNESNNESVHENVKVNWDNNALSLAD